MFLNIPSEDLQKVVFPMLKSDNPLNKFRIITPTLNNWFICQHFSIYKKAVTLQQYKISSTIQNALDHCIWLSLGDSDGCVNDLGRGREWATGTASPSSRPMSSLCHFPLHSPLIILLSLANCRRSYSRMHINVLSYQQSWSKETTTAQFSVTN